MSSDRHSFVAFYPSDWIGGTARMTRLQRSVYFDICCYCWDKATECPAAELPLMFGDVDDWQQVIDVLVAADKLYKTDAGSVGNTRAISEAKKAFDLWHRKSEGGRKARAAKTDRKTPVITASGTDACTDAGLSADNQNQNQNQSKEDAGGAAAPAAPAPRRDDLAEAVRLYNETAARCGLPQAVKLSETRRRNLAARLRDCGGIEGWKAALAKLESIPGMRGGHGGHGHEGWRADFDFMVTEAKFTRLMEGKYDHWGRQPKPKPDGASSFLEATRELIQEYDSSGGGDRADPGGDP